MGPLSRVISDEDMTVILSDFDRLRGKCYLDNAGAAMFPKSLLQAINEDLTNNIYLNPHTDKYTSDCVDQVRFSVLRHFNASPDDYTVIFTSGSTASLKLVAETFNFSKGKYDSTDKRGAFVYLVDNHTSVLGMREIAAQNKAHIIPLNHDEFLNMKAQPYPEGVNENALLAFPAQNNFNGFKYPLGIIKEVVNGYANSIAFKSTGKKYKNWFVMLDAASYVSTSRLDLAVHKPDFVCISFYKIFGFPTGLGALIVKNASAPVLSQKTYFGGGTVDVLLSSEDFHVKRKNLYERFEDGTISFLSILSLVHCFNTLNRLIPKTVKNDLMTTISYHTFFLAKDLYEQLKRLKHPNGAPAAILYLDSDFSDPEEQGGIVTFNLLRSDGTYIGYAEFQHMANLFNISLRTGCFCNNGSCQRHLKLSAADIMAGYNAGHVCGDEMDLFLGKPTGCVRVSFSYYNTFKNVDDLMTMICKCFVEVDTVKPDRSAVNGFDLVKPNNIAVKLTNVYVSSEKITDWIDAEKDITDASNGVLDEMAIYPVKSCGAYKPGKRWRIGAKGLEYDREWMIVRDNGTCLTQKQCTRMCMLRPDFDFDNNLLILNFPGMPTISIPIELNNTKRGINATFCQSKVCTDFIQGYDCGEKIGDWISEALEISFLRLIKHCDRDKRRLKNVDTQKLLSLSNQAQFLLVNKATVRWLTKEIQDDSFDKDLGGMVDRFRANLIVDTGVELVEKEWKEVLIGKHIFKVDGPCTRCQMVCIDQENGEKTAEPLRTISKLFGGKLRFGIYVSYAGTIDKSNDTLIHTNSPFMAYEQCTFS